MYCPNPNCPSVLEYGEAAEFRDGVTQCHECGHELEHGDAPAAPATEADRPEPLPEVPHAESEDWPRIAVFDGPEAAHTAKGLLESEGIEVQILDEYFAGTLAAPVTLLGGVALAVPERDSERALALIQDLSVPDRELPLDDPYVDDDFQHEDEGFQPNAEPWAAAPEARARINPIQILALLLFVAAVAVTLRECDASETHDRASASEHRESVSSVALGRLSPDDFEAITLEAAS